MHVIDFSFEEPTGAILETPQFRYYALAEANLAKGVVVVIDVLRAFTTAAYAFNAGVLQIFPVGTIEDAFRLHRLFSESAIMGEVDGHKPEGFDFSNSPAELSNIDLSDKRLIQRTTAGTQGIIRAKNARMMLAASFVVAKATADHLRIIHPDLISFVITGQSLGRDGEEDWACAEYIEALVQNGEADQDLFTSRVLTSSVGQAFSSGQLGYLSLEDLQLSLDTDRFEFCLTVHKENGLLVMNKETVS